MIRVLIVDDQPPFRLGLCTLLSRQKDLEIVGEAGDGEQAVALVERLRPDVVLMDVRMPRVDGIAATTQIMQSYPRTRVMVLTTFEDDDAVRAAMRAGAVGYVLKDTPADDLAALIAMAHRGYSQFSPGVAERLIEPVQLNADPKVSRLSEREREVLHSLGEGLSNRDIARRLFLSEGTVRNHVTSILSRLGLSNRMQAALYANGLWPDKRHPSAQER